MKDGEMLEIRCWGGIFLERVCGGRRFVLYGDGVVFVNLLVY